MYYTQVHVFSHNGHLSNMQSPKLIWNTLSLLLEKRKLHVHVLGSHWCSPLVYCNYFQERSFKYCTYIKYQSKFYCASIVWHHTNNRQISRRWLSLLSHLSSVDSWKLCGVCVAINYTPLSMAYYAYDNTINFLSLGSTVFICISKEWRCKKKLRSVGNFEFEPVVQKLSRLFWGSTELDASDLPTTLQPLILAIWPTMDPTAPAAPVTTSVSPSLGWQISRNPK